MLVTAETASQVGLTGTATQLEKEPNIPELWEHLQDYYAHTGNYGSAEECRNKALEIRSVRRRR